MKESTRVNILNSSRKIFNEKGYYNTTLRQIAYEINISQGNLTYHFKKKEEIVLELYGNFQLLLNSAFTETTQLGANFYFIFELARKTFEILKEYRFFISDLSYLINDIPELGPELMKVKENRIDSFKKMFDAFVSKKYMRKEEYETEFDELAHRLYLLSFYSILPVGIDHQNQEDEGLKKYVTIILSSCYPYLTKTGKEKYFLTLQDYSFKRIAKQ